MNNQTENGEPIVWYSGENPEMQAAIRAAQDSFSEFEAQIKLESRRVIPALQQCLIKYAFLAAPDSRVNVEHMFLSDIRHDGKNIVGILASEPIYVEAIQEGDEIVVDKSRVTDWLYILEDQTHGGFTFRQMWRGFSKEEKEAYRNHPPFEWLNLK